MRSGTSSRQTRNSSRGTCRTCAATREVSHALLLLLKRGFEHLRGGERRLK